MHTWTVWSRVKGSSAIVATGLTEKQALDIVNHLHEHCSDTSAIAEED